MGRAKQDEELPIVLHTNIVRIIQGYYSDKPKNRFRDAMALYIFLYATTRRQNNIRVWAKDTFILKGTGIGKRTLPSIKRDLERMGLIKLHRERKPNGQMGQTYIEVQVVWKPEPIEKLFRQERNEDTEYKIARALLIENFKEYEAISCDGYIDFDVDMDGKKTVWANTFFFDEEDVLIAHDTEMGFYYTVPTHRVGEVIKTLASGYKFSYSAILRVLDSRV